MLLLTLPTQSFSAKERWEDDSRETSPQSSLSSSTATSSSIQMATLAASASSSTTASSSASSPSPATAPASSAPGSAQLLASDKSTTLETSNDYRGGQLEPLKWFGYLVSPHLRTSQTHFKKGLRSTGFPFQPHCLCVNFFFSFLFLPLSSSAFCFPRRSSP